MPTLDIEIIVPEFNESSRDPEFNSKLDYLSKLAETFDVRLVDDASTDGSWKKICEYMETHHPKFRASRMITNGQKVGAIISAVEESTRKYVLLTDFDSTISTPEGIGYALKRFERNSNLAGIALKVVPDGKSILAGLQDIEYLTTHVYGGYTGKQKKVWCVPGAGGIWRKDVLKEVLQEHSGRHNGDDLETTAIAMRKGYDIGYDPSIVVKTIVPESISSLHKQRKRHELGWLETVSKEKGFYYKQARNLKNRLGHVTLLQTYYWATLPLGIASMAQFPNNPQAFASYYLTDLAITGLMSYLKRDDLKSKKELALVPLMPIYRPIVSLPAKVAAVYEFFKSNVHIPDIRPRASPNYIHVGAKLPESKVV